jgi:hypothetical protein
MVNWIQAWWQVRQSWSFLRHAYRCGWSLYDNIADNVADSVAGDVADAWSHRSYAMAYAVAQVTPRAKLSGRI